ncbi:hypothetical protein H072_8797 [Dactylellina haptotyla CBS 200.50]|uniref:Copper acquisition factor BIM1-like domain-containing protein n=1 Tax=Dactylellina haptotyla (strain CBS 200.50) TaxID=1284197 RepID=S8A3D4_DACHA|nr:hypothetical protein H072_8797 [Dactylellina haptotyla CBS 200.50]
MNLRYLSILAAALLPAATAHFVLQVPVSLGFEDEKEDQSPCGGFDIKGRTTVTDWPIGGYPIGVVSTHPDAVWQIRAALLENTSEFVDLVPDIKQQGMGNFCLSSIPGYAAWVGKDAVLQVIQTAADGQLFQCAAIKFVDGSAASVPGNCKNGTNVVASVDPSYTASMGSPTSAPTSAPTSGQTSTPTSNSPSTTTGAPTTTTSTSAAIKSINLPVFGTFAVVLYILDCLF